MFNSCPRNIFSVNTLSLPMAKALVWWAWFLMSRMLSEVLRNAMWVGEGGVWIGLGSFLPSNLLHAGP